MSARCAISNCNINHLSLVDYNECNEYMAAPSLGKVNAVSDGVGILFFVIPKNSAKLDR